MANQYLPPVIQIPSALQINAITQSYPMAVSVVVGNDSTEANTYIPGMLVKLVIPWTYGMWQANNQNATILSIVGSVFFLDLDSTTFDPFAIPFAPATPAMLVPAGSRNLQLNNETKKVPFQSLNNIGN